METPDVEEGDGQGSAEGPHSLGTLIEWKLTYTKGYENLGDFGESPLAGDIN